MINGGNLPHKQQAEAEAYQSGATLHDPMQDVQARGREGERNRDGYRDKQHPANRTDAKDS